MSGLWLEPPAVPADADGQQWRPAGPPGVDDLISRVQALASRRADPRSALASAALASAAFGLLGFEGGIIWIVAGVWTVRAMAGGSVGLAWGIAVVGVGMRWGTLGLADLEVATRITGPSVLSGALPVRIALGAALLAAVADEALIAAHGGGLASRTWGERAAAALALAALPPLFFVRGPVEAVSLPTLVWAGSAAALTAAVLLGRRVTGFVPEWLPVVTALVAVAVSVLAS